ncbi:MAG: class I SAM-dependent methyltransferase [Chloroflexota bacterium]
MTPTFTSQFDQSMRRYYDLLSREYDEWHHREGKFADRPDNNQWHAEISQLCERVQPFGYGRLLEIAAGTGRWTQYLARHAKVVALDYAPLMLQQTQLRLHKQNMAAQCVRGDAYTLPFGAASFDGCFFGFWLSHVPLVWLQAFLADVRRVVRRGGQVLVVDSAPKMPERQPNVEYILERVLNDESRHDVLKIFHTPETLAATLTPLGKVLDTWATGRFFSGAVVEVV